MTKDCISLTLDESLHLLGFLQQKTYVSCPPYPGFFAYYRKQTTNYFRPPAVQPGHSPTHTPAATPRSSHEWAPA